MPDYSDAVKLQKEIAKKVVASDAFEKIERVCGADVAYDGGIAYCSAVVMGSDLEPVESVDIESVVTHPYMPGFLMLREAGPVMQAVKILKQDFDLLMVDGHGLLHPRRCGLACYVGVRLGKPTIGVAKSRLCGTERPDGFVEVGDQVCGQAVQAGRKKIYVSTGHKVSLRTAVEIVKAFSRKNGMPEPLRVADINSKRQKREKGLKP
jgi:deoxyribonuclease V